MDWNAKIFVAGHRGMAGSAIVRSLARRGATNVVTRSHADLDLTSQAAVGEFLAAERPRIVVLAAAKVGGIHANDAYPAEFIYENLMIEANVIHQAWRSGVRELLFLGSSCIYPRDCPQPIREEYLLTGPLESSNRAYAVAKIAGVEMCRAYNKQHGTRFLAAMPTNLYGPGDSYDLANSHVLPALIRKAHEALPEGGALIVYESIIDDERSKNAFGLLMSLNMLIETPGGFDYTGADCMHWMKEVGFRETRVEHLVGPDSMVVGIK